MLGHLVAGQPQGLICTREAVSLTFMAWNILSPSIVGDKDLAPGTAERPADIIVRGEIRSNVPEQTTSGLKQVWYTLVLQKTKSKGNSHVLNPRTCLLAHALE